MMNILAFDTAGDFLSVGIQTEAGFFEENRFSGLSHSEHLLPSVERLMKRADLKFKNLDLIVCSKGPGSFTGLRIGMSTAKGISTGCGTPIVSVNNLDIHSHALNFFDGAVVSVIDARKKRFYSAVYSKGKLVSDYFDISAQDLIKYLNNKYDRVLFTGPGSELLKKNITDNLLDIDFSVDYFQQKNGVSFSMIERGIDIFNKDGADPDDSGPFYIRLSDAELSRL